MTPNATDRDSERKTHSDVVVALMLAAAALAITIYSAAFVARLIAEWFVRPY